MKRDRFYITTPIYYVNDKPHIGHAYTTILADVLTRYHRLFGIPSYFLTGTDEHGQKVYQAAEKNNVTPQQHVDSTVVRYQELWKKLNISNDDFIRTTEPRHKIVVQKILQDLFDRDEIYRAEYDGWYCVTCERFYMEKDLVEGLCPEPGCGKKVDKIREANYFFRMGKYKDWLVKHIQDNPGFIQPDFRRNETLGFLKKDLNDLCISRPKTRMNWGIEIPFDSNFVTYVWFDALVNYISAIGYQSDDKKFSELWPATYHLIGKDILTTHTVYWPTMLKAMGVPQPETVFAHGWWMYGNDKMSKSMGNVVNPMDMIDKYGADPFRYFLMAEMSLGQDASFSEEAFTRRYNAELANDLGNLASRVMKLTEGHLESVANAASDEGDDESVLRDAVINAVRGLRESVFSMKLDQGIAGIAGAVREVNKYMEKKQPWTLAKQGRKAELSTALYYGIEALRIISGALYPVMPSKMAELRIMIGSEPPQNDYDSLVNWGQLKSGTKIGKMASLFPRIVAEKSPVKEENSADAKKPAAVPVDGVASIEYTDFQKVQLRVAKVLEAEKVQGADKLLRLVIELGAEKRQIIAGIALHYKPEDMVGKTIIVVANLKPAKIRGLESNGMLLAASSAGVMKLLSVDEVMPSGSVIK